MKPTCLETLSVQLEKYERELLDLAAKKTLDTLVTYSAFGEIETERVKVLEKIVVSMKAAQTEEAAMACLKDIHTPEFYGYVPPVEG